MPDVGTARADFPGGDAHALYTSIRKLLSLPPNTRMFVCHDYPPDDRETRCETNVAEQRQRNMRGGKLPPVEKNGVRYIKVPLDLL